MISASGRRRARPNPHPPLQKDQGAGHRKSAAPPPTPPEEVLGRFSDALSLLTVAHRSLSSQELGGIGDEAVTLKHALDALKAVYNELDAAAVARPEIAERP